MGLFVSYEIAKQLKSKGFNEYCLSYYETEDVFHLRGYFFNDDDIAVAFVLRPMYQQVIDWFRLKHNILLTPLACGSTTKILGYEWFVQVRMESTCYATGRGDYYEQLENAIKEALKLI